jgi:DNA-binding transcriptional LysR family regulator
LQNASLSKLDFRQLDQFLAVVDQGGFRGAARALNIAQPAVSRNVGNLENALGVQLLERSRRGVKLTPAGATLADGARSLRKEIRDLAQRTLLADRGEIGELGIGYTDFAIAGVLPEIVKRFRARHPRVRLRFVPLVTSDQIEALRLGTIDAAMLTGPINLDGFEARLAQSDPLVCFVPETHRLASLKSVKLAELANEDFVLGENRGWAHFLAHVMSLCLTRGFLPRVVQEANDSTAILGLVSAGIGITLNIERNAMRKSGGFSCLALSDTNYEIETLLVRKAGNENPLADNLFSILDEVSPVASRNSMR